MRAMHSRQWLIAIAVILAALSPGVRALRVADAQGGGALTVALDQEPPTLDPHASPSAVTYQIIASVAENLLYRGPDGKLVPWLAESWTTARDGKSVTFKLRRDVKFHDGTPFNANAAKVSLDRIRDAALGSPNRSHYAPIESVTTPSDDTLVINTSQPMPVLLEVLAEPWSSISSPAALAKYGKEIGFHPAARQISANRT